MKMSLWWSSRVVAWVWWVLVARTAAVVGRSTLGMQPAQDVRPDQIENTLESDRSKRDGLSIEDGKNVLRKLHVHRLWEQRRKNNRHDLTKAGKRSVVAADYFDENDLPMTVSYGNNYDQKSE